MRFFAAAALLLLVAPTCCAQDGGGMDAGAIFVADDTTTDTATVDDSQALQDMQALQDTDIEILDGTQQGQGGTSPLGQHDDGGARNGSSTHAPRRVNVSAAFAEAMDVTFSMNSASVGASNHTASVLALRDLMFRMNVPHDADTLRRGATDQQLLRLAMLASVGAISMWKRDPVQRLVLSDDGKLMLQYAPSAIESDVMMCIICVLLALILMFHVVAAPQQPQQTSTTTSSAAVGSGLKGGLGVT